MPGRDRIQRFCDILSPEIFTTMIDLNNEWRWVLQNKFFNASCNSTHGLFRKWANSMNPVLLEYFLARRKNRRAWKIEVQHISYRHPRFFHSCQCLKAIWRCMRRFRPDNRFSVTACNQKEPFSNGRRSIIACPHRPILDLVPLPFELADKSPESFTLVPRIWSIILIKPSPVLKFFYVFQHDNARMHCFRPLYRNPRQPSNMPADRLSAFRPAVMLTVRRKPRQRHRPPRTSLDRIDLPNILLIMLGCRMVCSVHRNRRRVMVDGNIHAAAYCHFNTR